MNITMMRNDSKRPSNVKGPGCYHMFPNQLNAILKTRGTEGLFKLFSFFTIMETITFVASQCLTGVVFVQNIDKLIQYGKNMIKIW